MDPGEDIAPLQAVEPAYKNVLRVRMAAFWLVVGAASLVVNATLLSTTPFAGALPAAVLFVAVGALVTTPERIYRRLAYRLTGRLLQVLRGWLFHIDTVVPLVRVQHIDITRGPIDKMFGTATLVIHTAGTHNSIVSLPGLSPERAAEIRDTIREHVRTDYA